jgi:hypothetical protein
MLLGITYANFYGNLIYYPTFTVPKIDKLKFLVYPLPTQNPKLDFGFVNLLYSD